ncbi:MAG: hypothetical protein PHX80_03940 [Candidatus Nanoarchaeia archaeon]|nr:hypothetical protein [Candidatus Nanoarchaeia archaeon]
MMKVQKIADGVARTRNMLAVSIVKYMRENGYKTYREYENANSKSPGWFDTKDIEMEKTVNAMMV